MSNVFNSSIGRKLVMSLAGLFLISFLVVHLGINILLVIFESREPFNIAAHFMGTNPVIKVFEIVLFGGFFLHIIYGVILFIQNSIARGSIRYKISNHSQTSFFSKYMIHSAAIITIFLVIHLMDFYIAAKFLGEAPEIMINGELHHDLGLLVVERFKIGWVVAFYCLSMVLLAFHLHHGFQSAFQTLGINHKRYSPTIHAIGVIYSIIVPLGFMLIPLYFYFIK
ncbi:MAG: succinate dehydrogenase cytochrome b subunit [Bacteroidota bacterium]